MKQALRIASLCALLALTVGCFSKRPDTFTFSADLPPNFTYQAIAVYVPAKGQTCTVPGGRNTEVGFNLRYQDTYQPNAQMVLYRTVSGCPLVINRISLDIYSTYGPDHWDMSRDSAGVAIRYELEEQYKGTFDDAGESVFYGQCQWLFRTMGPKRRIIKILDCKKTNPQGEPGRGRPFSAYTLDQLPGKTLKMKISLAEIERPAFGRTWIKVPNGWKRCLGKSFAEHTYCFRDKKNEFSGFSDARRTAMHPLPRLHGIRTLSHVVIARRIGLTAQWSRSGLPGRG